MCNRVAEGTACFPNWIDKVQLTDKALCHLNGVVNHFNHVCWRNERPEEIDESCWKSPKMTASCAVNAKTGFSGHAGLRKAEEELCMERATGKY